MVCCAPCDQCPDLLINHWIFPNIFAHASLCELSEDCDFSLLLPFTVPAPERKLACIGKFLKDMRIHQIHFFYYLCSVHNTALIELYVLLWCSEGEHGS